MTRSLAISFAVLAAIGTWGWGSSVSKAETDGTKGFLIALTIVSAIITLLLAVYAITDAE